MPKVKTSIQFDWKPKQPMRLIMSEISYQCRLFNPILMLVMVNYKHKKACNREQSEKHPDPVRIPPSNRAPVIGSPPPHLRRFLPQFTTKSQIHTDPCPRFNQKAIEQSLSAYVILFWFTWVRHRYCPLLYLFKTKSSETEANNLYNHTTLNQYFPLPLSSLPLSLPPSSFLFTFLLVGTSESTRIELRGKNQFVFKLDRRLKR